jgi:hypothetical protein
MSEFLRKQQSGSKISEQQHGQHKSNGGDGVDWHGLPQLVAGLDVGKADGKEDGGEGEHDNVLHGSSWGA